MIYSVIKDHSDSLNVTVCIQGQKPVFAVEFVECLRLGFFVGGKLLMQAAGL